jgi:hypothetical protein
MCRAITCSLLSSPVFKRTTRDIREVPEEEKKIVCGREPLWSLRKNLCSFANQRFVATHRYSNDYKKRLTFSHTYTHARA